MNDRAGSGPSSSIGYVLGWGGCRIDWNRTSFASDCMLPIEGTHLIDVVQSLRRNWPDAFGSLLV